MGERSAVAESNERVHDRRGLQHGLDAVVRDRKEEVRLDQLEDLVRERRRVDGDLGPHAPRRMLERLLWGHRRQLVACAAAERTAGAGEHERVDLFRLATLETLEERRMLAVDRQDATAAASLRCERELARRDEALLVRKRKVGAVLERPQRRVHPGEADDRVEDDVGLRTVEELGQG